MPLTLHNVAQAYLVDEEFQRSRQRLAESRNESIPSLQGVIHHFIQADESMNAHFDRFSFPTELPNGGQKGPVYLNINKKEKSTLRFPLEKPIPYDLVSEIVSLLKKEKGLYSHQRE